MLHIFLVLLVFTVVAISPAVAQPVSDQTSGYRATEQFSAPANPYGATPPAVQPAPTTTPSQGAARQPSPAVPVVPVAPTVTTPVVANPVATTTTPQQKDPCAAYMGSYQTYAFCRDRVEKIKRMQLAKDKRAQAVKENYERRQQRRNPQPKEASPPTATPATTGEPTPGVATPATGTAPATPAATPAPSGETPTLKK